MNPVLKVLVVALSLSIIIFGCDKDNPVDEDNHGEHAEAVGLVISQSGAEIVRYENGTVTGKISVAAGEETPLLSVKFIDEHDSELFTPEGEHHSLGWTIADESIAEVEKHEEDGEWMFHIKGKITGNTTIEIKIMHEDHADFVSAPIPIEVTS
jgi:hypothetical protein